jgi:hypothetical protein
MDISRHWRLKASRSQLVAVRVPGSETPVLAQQRALSAPEHGPALYHFEVEEPLTVVDCCTDVFDTVYAKAAR